MTRSLAVSTEYQPYWKPPHFRYALFYISFPFATIPQARGVYTGFHNWASAFEPARLIHVTLFLFFMYIDEWPCVDIALVSFQLDTAV